MFALVYACNYVKMIVYTYAFNYVNSYISVYVTLTYAETVTRKSQV